MRSSSESQDQAIVANLLRAIAGVVAAYRFGSTAQGTATLVSDTDIAVLTPTRLTPEQRFEAQEALAATLA